MNDSSSTATPSSSPSPADPLLQTEQTPSPSSSRSAPTSSRRSRRLSKAALDFDDALTDPRGEGGSEARYQRILEEGLSRPSYDK